MGIDKIIEMHELAKSDSAKYPQRRFLYDLIDAARGQHFVGVLGPRGAGKTSL